MKLSYVSTVNVTRLPASPVPGTLLDRVETLTDAIATLATGFPDHPCLVVLDRDRRERFLTLGTLWRAAGQVGAALVARGLRPGRFVLLALPTGPELLAAYFGVMRAGGIPGLIAPPSNRFADRHVYAAYLSALARQAEAHSLYCDAAVAEAFQADVSALPDVTMLTPADVARSEAAPPPLTAAPDDVATVQYSSGSTGIQKGVLLSHRAILANIAATRDAFDLTSTDVSVNWIPLYHDMGLIDAFLMPVLGGTPAVLIPTMDFMREPALWLWALHRYRGAFSIAPNFAYALCARRIPDAELVGLDLSCWRVAANGSEPALASTIEDFTRRFSAYGFRREAMTPTWGLAENVCIATVHAPDEPPLIETVDRDALATENVARPRRGGGLASVSVGRAIPGCTLQIRDADRRPLPDRHVGEIWVRSTSLFLGYHHDAELTARILVDGWLDTGDRGYLADGHLHFVSREKDLIVIGGEKYAPHDLETIINRVPGVREGCTAVFGVLNEVRGTEDIAAVVETRETDVATLTRLEDTIRAEITRATGLGLRHVILVPPGGVEKTTSGKLARSATQRRYADRLMD